MLKEKCRKLREAGRINRRDLFHVVHGRQFRSQTFEAWEGRKRYINIRGITAEDWETYTDLWSELFISCIDQTERK